MSIGGAIQIVDNVFVKLICLNKSGDKVEGHVHTFDHITLLSTGKVVMRAKGNEVVHIAPKLLVTPKGVSHEFEALEDNTVLSCIHAIRDGDGEDDVAPQEITKAQAEDFLQKFPLTE